MHQKDTQRTRHKWRAHTDIVRCQKDDASIIALLRRAFANIVMTEFEKVIVDNLVKERTIRFHVPYGDDTLSLVEKLTKSKRI